MDVLIDAVAAFFASRLYLGWKIVAVLALALLALVAVAALTH